MTLSELDRAKLKEAREHERILNGLKPVKPRKRFYVGRGNGKAEIFRSEYEPTPETHGHLYAAVIGPFRTHAGAEALRNSGGMLRSVQEAEAYCDRLKRALYNVTWPDGFQE